MTTMPSTERRGVSPGSGSLRIGYEYSPPVDSVVPAHVQPIARTRNNPDQINIFAGGWDDDADEDDDDEDYVDMAPVYPHRASTSNPVEPPPRTSSLRPGAGVRTATSLVTTRSNDSGYYDAPGSESASLLPPVSRRPNKGDLPPSVVVEPASPQGSLHSYASGQHSHSASPVPSSDGTSTSDSSEYSSDRDSPTHSDRTRATSQGEDSLSSLTPQSDVENRPVSTSPPPSEREESETVAKHRRSNSKSEVLPTDKTVTAPPPPGPRSGQTTAGQAARIYLQMQGGRTGSRGSYERDNVKSGSGLQRSSSRVGGVKSRISKNRNAPQASFPVRSHSVEDLPPSNGSVESVKMRHSSSSKASSDFKINEAKRKSRTLDRDLSGVLQNSPVEEKQSVSVQEFMGGMEGEGITPGGKCRTKDGASVMRMITDRQKSQSLDAKYLEYLDGISRHASTSSPSTPSADDAGGIAETDPERDTKHKKRSNKKVTKEEEYDEEEEFRKYASTMSAKTRSPGNGSIIGLQDLKALNAPPAQESGFNLSDFASMRSRDKAKAEKVSKRKQTSLTQKLSFRKSKTLGRVTTETQYSFAEAAQAFHEQLSKQTSAGSDGDKAHKKQAPPSEGKAKSNSLKREKRKSWKLKRHGLSIRSKSKDRINSDTSNSTNLEDENSSLPTSPSSDSAFAECEFRNLDLSRDSTKQKNGPIIKQSLGYNSNASPSLRPRKALVNDMPQENRLRTASFEQNTPEHSPKIMSPSTMRSMTLDSRRQPGKHPLIRVNSGGHLGTIPNSRSITSLNSENSGSNSDINHLDDEFDEHRIRSVGKSGTLSRIMGKKSKDRGDYDSLDSPGFLSDIFSTGSLGRRKKRGKSSAVDSPAMTLRSRHAHSREALLEAAGLTRVDLFFDSREFVRGFRVVWDDDNDENEDAALEFERAMRYNGVVTSSNKYATITGTRSPSYRNYESKKRASDTTISKDTPDGNTLPVHGKRNHSMPEAVDTSSLKTKSSKGGRFSSRSPLKGPAGHLSFNEALTEDEVVSHPGSISPLRTRKVQAIEPLLAAPSEKILSASKIIYRRLLASQPEIVAAHDASEERDQFGSVGNDSSVREHEGTTYPNSVYGQELVSWMMAQVKALTSVQDSSEATTVSIMTSWSRWNVAGMMQALLEEGVLYHVRREHHFQDTYLLYQFHDSVTRNDSTSRPVSVESTVSSAVNSDVHSTTSGDTDSQNTADPSSDESRRPSQVSSNASWPQSHPVDDQELKEILSLLHNVAPDAMFRMVLRKLPEDRTAEELMMIYEEILHIKALAHLSDSVKRELAGVLKFEFHRKRGKTLFSQGDEGRSWYIIVKGSVDVDIQGQGVVCTLHEGDDFGNLAIINDAPRAATIVLAEDNCQLLRVDKHDFVRILKDVEANTVRLKEHDQDVLILQKIHARSASSGRQEKPVNNKAVHRGPPVAATPTRHSHKYAISAGTAAKIVEHIVKALRPWSTARQSDEAMEDLILMYQVFMSTQELCKQLMRLYQSEQAEQIDPSKSIKRKVVYFVVRWSHIATHIFYDQPAVGPFLKELKQAVTDDVVAYPNLKEDLARVYLQESSATDSPTHKGWISVESARVQRYPQVEGREIVHQAIKASDDVMLKVFNANRTYTTVRLPTISTVTEIISAVAEKQGRKPENLLLIQVQSDGDMYVLPKNMTSAATSVGVNSRLFICSPDEKDEIEPLEEQHILPTNNSSVLELASSQEIAEHVTQFDGELINSIHVMEFVHKVFGSHKFHSVTSNIDVFARRFNQLAYWAPTEICACNNLNKRVHLLRKFIKIAQHLKELQNMNAFMAVIIGLGNQAVSRLHSTWDKLPTKYKKMMTEFEAILDPSRNHRAYRLYVANLRSPMIPYLPLLMKDMTFQHEGNDSTRNGLVNFEKMHMMSNSIRGVIQACSKRRELTHAIVTSKTYEDCRQYCRNFVVVTDQKSLNQLSGRSEPKRQN